MIGAGIGGIGTAAILSRQGCDVTIFEKNPYPGGRCGCIQMDGHRFDTGATFLMMPGIYNSVFELAGKEMREVVRLHRIDPIYKVKFPGDTAIRFTSDLASLQQQFEKIEKGSYGHFLKLLNKGFCIYENSMQLIDRNYFRILDPSLIKYPFLLLKYKAFSNHYRFISRYFKSDDLRALFTFQNLYLGQNPLAASGMYTFLPFMEISDGVYFPEGGMHRVAESLLSIAREQGVEVQLGAPVARIDVNHRLAKGVELEDGTFHPADIIVSNADVPFVYNKLLPQSRMAKRLQRKKYSCSAMAFHWAVDKVYDQLDHHTVFVSRTHKESCDTIFRKNGFAQEPSIYVHSPARTDPTAAPPGHDSITAIVHTGNLDENGSYDWEKIKARTREGIIRRLEEEGLEQFGEHIQSEICFTPESWYTEFNLTRGGTFGSLAHNLMQMGFMRPANHHRRYRNLYFTGGSTQPGSGMPLSLLSAKLVTERIRKEQL